jgi:hypothetical protein
MGNNQTGGKLAKDVGKTFELLFEAHTRQRGMGFVKIPDGAYRIKTPYGIKLVACKTPFDYFICKNGQAACLDVKTVESNRFSYSHCDRNQLESLDSMGSHVAAGYVIWFRTSDRVCFFSHIELNSLQRLSSLTDHGGLYLGSIDSFDPEKIISSYKPSSKQGVLKI